MLQFDEALFDLEMPHMIRVAIKLTEVIQSVIGSTVGERVTVTFGQEYSLSKCK